MEFGLLSIHPFNQPDRDNKKNRKVKDCKTTKHVPVPKTRYFPKTRKRQEQRKKINIQDWFLIGKGRRGKKKDREGEKRWVVRRGTNIRDPT